MEPKEINKLLLVLDRLSCFSINCTECPYNTSDDCEGELKRDLSEALKRLKFLETATEEEQPELIGFNVPNIEKENKTELETEFEKYILPEIGDPDFYEKMAVITKAKADFENLIFEDNNVIALRAYNVLKRKTEIPSIEVFTMVEKERYLILDTVGPKVFDYICKKYDQARKQLGLPYIEIDQEKLEKVKYGKIRWPWTERKLFSKNMNEIFS